MADLNHLFGTCACQRNQYEILIPTQSASLAQVFFDNTALSRRSQSAPVTMWLRVPLDWYSSATIARFPDESHSSIKRTFNTQSSNPTLPETRRQFCGYCGSHLTRWDESLHQYTTTNDSGYLDVTLGSLLNESLEKLEALRILPEESDEESSTAGAEGMVRGATINDEDHIPTNEEAAGGVDSGSSRQTPVRTATSLRAATRPPHLMQHRGIPYFEEMVENSRLGRIKHRMGGHTSEDGTTSVQWEVFEIGGDEPMPDVSADVSEPPGSKRLKLDR